MSEFNQEDVDWHEVSRKMKQALQNLEAAEAEIVEGFENPESDLTATMMESDDVPHDVDELVKGLTNSRSWLDNGTLNYIPNN